MYPDDKAEASQSEESKIPEPDAKTETPDGESTTTKDDKMKLDSETSEERGKDLGNVGRETAPEKDPDNVKELVETHDFGC